MSNSSTQITWKPRFGEYKAPEQTVQSALNEMHQKLSDPRGCSVLELQRCNEGSTQSNSDPVGLVT